jgi:hypothetical protein
MYQPNCNSDRRKYYPKDHGGTPSQQPHNTQAFTIVERAYFGRVRIITRNRHAKPGVRKNRTCSLGGGRWLA